MVVMVCCHYIMHLLLFFQEDEIMATKKETKPTKGKRARRLDKERIALRKGEQQRADGVYEYRWTTPDGKRHSVYAGTLELLRKKEDQVAADIRDGIKTETKLITVNEAFDMWCQLKRGIEDNTFQNYKYMYNQFIRSQFGKLRLTIVEKSDVRRFYNSLADGKILKVSTMETIHNILHEVLSMAVVQRRRNLFCSQSSVYFAFCGTNI